ncbi:MAG: hypothetical protein ACRDZX_14435 [Acidimicrobiales bacterium]
MIGAFAAQAFGAPLPPTLDIDFTPASSPENPGRLASALHELRCGVDRANNLLL